MSTPTAPPGLPPEPTLDAGEAAPAAAAGVGRRVPRHDAEIFLRGHAEYFDDVELPTGTLHVALVRSPHPRARIRGVDGARASAAPGVAAVVTAADLDVAAIPHNVDPAGIGGQSATITPLATTDVLYVGHPVAAVLAERAADATAAAALVDVDYELLEPVLDVHEAVAPDAPVLVAGWADNVIARGVLGDGDVAAAEAAAEHVITGEVRLHRAAPVPLETRGYLARWDRRTRRLTFRGTVQNPHPLRWHLATALGIAEHQVRIVAPVSGGSFGQKMHGHPEEVLVAALARRLDRPVKWVETRRESLLVAGRELRCRYTAADADGVVTGLRMAVDGNLGAPSAAAGWGMVMVGCLTAPNGYAIPALEVSWRAVVTNKSPWNGVRSYGKEITHVVLERVMEQVATAAGRPGEEIRRRNWVRAEQFPYRTPTGLDLDSGDYAGLLRLVDAHVDVSAVRAQLERERGDGRLVGLGWGFEVVPESVDLPGSLVGGMDTSTVRMDSTGHVTVLTGVTSPGSGSDTGIAQLVAGALGISLESVRVVQGDTDHCPYGFGNLSSRSIVAGGAAALLAARDVAERLRTVAAAMLHVDADVVELGEGMARGRGSQDQMLPVAAVANAVYTLAFILALGIEPSLESTRTYRPGNIRHIPDELGPINPLSTYSNALALVLVELDPQTGEVELRRVVLAHDCGTVVNPHLVDGQLHGGVAMGVSTVLSEEIPYSATGESDAIGFKTYLVLRAPDLPRVELLHQCTPTPYTLLGAKGAGESGVGASMSAVLNAVNDALAPRGVEITSTPLSPERVLAALATGGQR